MDYEELSRKYNEAIKYIKILEKENIRLKNQIGEVGSLSYAEEINSKSHNYYNELIRDKSIEDNQINDLSTNKEKVELYLSLFRGREDICAKRWVSKKTGKSGYAPYCYNDWIEGICGKKTKIKCKDCKNQKFVALNEAALRKHFKGEEVLGLYPIDEEDMCYLIVMDFDKASWQKEITTVASVCKEFNIPTYTERSRSGYGGHLWFFFEDKVKASKARKFASIILDYAMEKDSNISFVAYDRLIPSQDFLQKDGFGNLISLPLQKEARDNDNSVFIDHNFETIEDQWKYLSQIERIRESAINEFIALNSKNNAGDKGLQKRGPISVKKLDFPNELEVILQNGIWIHKESISSKGIVYLRRMASYLNPEFYSKQAMRMSTYNTPRMTVVYEENDEEIILPIGVLTKLLDNMQNIGIIIHIRDERNIGEIIDVKFNGQLRPEQQLAFDGLNRYDNGVLSATTGFGKTVLGAKLIAEHKTSTLILVHTKVLALQWIERLEQFLKINYEVEEIIGKRGRKKKISLIGQLGGGKKQLTGKIDIALMQSMFNSDKSVKDIVDDYGMVIVDECHHVSASNFSIILSRIKSKFVYGLTATPIRKDGHHHIIFMYCGPIRYKVDAKKQAQKRTFNHYIIPRFTSCRKPLYQKEEEWHISDVMKHLCDSNSRNEMIVSDVDRVVEEGRNPIILTERSSHIGILKSLMVDKPYEIIELSGRLKTKERKEAFELIRNGPSKKKMVIIATGKLVGEGFDVQWLDTLFLAMPIAWKGTITQYAGRLHRESDGKNEACVYDYIDVHISKMAKMYSKRLTAYKSIGYKVKPIEGNTSVGDEIFSGDSYFKEFAGDIEQSSKVIIISSPFIQKRKFDSVKEELYRKFHEGVRVVVCIKEIDEYNDRTKINMHKLYSELINNGINVIQVQELKHKFAIFDDKIVWYGGVDLLGGNRGSDSVIRIVSSALSNELYGLLE